MNQYFFAILLAIVSSAWAETPIYIDVYTGPKIAYHMNNQPMAPEQLAKWLKATVAQFGDADPAVVRPSEDTTFKTVFALLTLLKDAGVKRIEVIYDEETHGTTEQLHGLRLGPDNIASWQRKLQQPPSSVPTK